MLDEAPSSLLVQYRGTLFRLGLKCLDLLKVLLHALDFSEDRMLLCIDALKS